MKTPRCFSTTTLKRMGYTVAVAHDGDPALEVAAQFQPAAALVDLQLPKISGYDLAPRLRALSGLENLRLVAATGHAEPSARQRSSEAGFDAHLVKPIGIRVLARTLEELLA
jgi:CheY-like chemotaxis protein